MRQKKKAIDLTSKLGSCKVAAITGIPESSLRRWSKTGPTRLSGSGRKPSFPLIEKKLLESFKELRSKGIGVNNASLLKMATEIADELHEENFVGSIGWVRGFRRRNRIVTRRRTRVSQKLCATSEEELRDFQKQIVDLIKLHKYDSEAILNIDEVGITFDNPSNYSLEIQVSNYLISFLIY